MKLKDNLNIPNKGISWLGWSEIKDSNKFIIKRISSAVPYSRHSLFKLMQQVVLKEYS